MLNDTESVDMLQNDDFFEKSDSVFSTYTFTVVGSSHHDTLIRDHGRDSAICHTVREIYPFPF